MAVAARAATTHTRSAARAAAARRLGAGSSGRGGGTRAALHFHSADGATRVADDDGGRGAAATSVLRSGCGGAQPRRASVSRSVRRPCRVPTRIVCGRRHVGRAPCRVLNITLRVWK